MDNKLTFNSVKTKCMKIYEDMCIQSVAKEVESLESQLRQDLIATHSDLMNSLSTLKERYLVSTESISYNQKSRVIGDIVERLLSKGYESLSRKAKEETMGELRI